MSREDQIEFKRSLISSVKEYPVIWDKENRHYSVAKESAWNDIEKSLNYSKRSLQTIWASFRRRYYDILMNKTMERDNTFPKWNLFHDMSFLYRDVKEKIEEKMGGISPPLLVPDPEEIAAQRGLCPCCIPTKTKENSNIIEIALSDLQSLFQAKNTRQTKSSLVLNPLHQGASTKPLSQPLGPKGNKIQTSQPVKTRKKYSRTFTKEDRTVEREKIIETIKAYPVLYAKDTLGPKCTLAFAWKRVAESVGLPLLTIQNRWRLFRRRYVEELMRERYANGPFQPKWPNFEQMSYMREYVKADIEDLDRVRQEMQQIVKEQKSRQTIDLCTDEDDPFLIANGNPPNSDKPPHQISISSTDIESYSRVQPVMCHQLEQNHKSDLPSQPSSVISLDLTSDEDDNIIYLDEFDATENDSSMEVYEEEIVYFAESLQDDIICLDDDDTK